MAGHPVLLALILASSATVPGQQPANSHVAVQAVDQTGAEIPNAQIQVVSQSKTLISTTTDQQGKADLNVPEGDFALIIKG
jgi:hypothetical protein